MKKIKELLFGVVAKPVCERPKPGATLTRPGPYTNYGDWCKEFRVSMLYDKKAIHLN